MKLRFERVRLGIATAVLLAASRDSDVVRIASARTGRTYATAYINGVQVLQATDHTYTSGSPGIGFYLEQTTGVNADYGFTRFRATDRPTNVSRVFAGGFRR